MSLVSDENIAAVYDLHIDENGVYQLVLQTTGFIDQGTNDTDLHTSCPPATVRNAENQIPIIYDTDRDKSCPSAAVYNVERQSPITGTDGIDRDIDRRKSCPLATVNNVETLSSITGTDGTDRYKSCPPATVRNAENQIPITYDTDRDKSCSSAAVYNVEHQCPITGTDGIDRDIDRRKSCPLATVNNVETLSSITGTDGTDRYKSCPPALVYNVETQSPITGTTDDTGCHKSCPSAAVNNVETQSLIIGTDGIDLHKSCSPAVVDNDNNNYEEYQSPIIRADLRNDTVDNSLNPVSSSSTPKTSCGQNQNTIECDEEVPIKQKRKRRKKAAPLLWKNNVNKKHRSDGLEYIGMRDKQKSVTIPAKTPKVMETCGCRFKCSEKFTAEQQMKFFEDYYDPKLNNDTRSAFLCNLIAVTDVQRRRRRPKKVPKTTERSCSRFYHLPNADGYAERVCLKFFCLVFDISFHIVNSALKQRSSTGIMIPIEHGNCGKEPHNKTSPEKEEEVKRHIDSFPKLPSHYSRKNSKKLYLSAELTLPKLHRLYSNEVEDPVKVDVYRRIFNSYEPPLSFYVPKKDRCTLCLNYETMGTQFTPEQLQLYHEHKERENISLEMKSQDMNSKTQRCVTFDVEGTLNIPKANNKDLYYKRKLHLYNFTLYENDASGTCYLWDETNGTKGCSEIASCLMDYIQKLPANIDHVTTWSDTCSSQNRNQFLLAAMVYMVNSTNVHTIDMKYLESGHSYMECDSMHSLVERSLKPRRIFNTAEMRMVLEEARLEPRPYEVNLVNYDQFFDVKSFAKSVIANHSKNTAGENVQYLKVKWFRFEKDSHQILYKYDYYGDFLAIDFLSTYRGKKRLNLPPRNALQRIADGLLKPTQLYSERLPISVAKKNDLISMLNKEVIPRYYSEFYNSLPSSASVQDTSPYLDNEDADDVQEFAQIFEIDIDVEV